MLMSQFYSPSPETMIRIPVVSPVNGFDHPFQVDWISSAYRGFNGKEVSNILERFDSIEEGNAVLERVVTATRREALFRADFEATNAARLSLGLEEPNKGYGYLSDLDTFPKFVEFFGRAADAALTLQAGTISSPREAFNDIRLQAVGGEFQRGLWDTLCLDKVLRDTKDILTSAPNLSVSIYPDDCDVSHKYKPHIEPGANPNGVIRYGTIIRRRPLADIELEGVERTIELYKQSTALVNGCHLERSARKDLPTYAEVRAIEEGKLSEEKRREIKERWTSTYGQVFGNAIVAPEKSSKDVFPVSASAIIAMRR